MKKILLILLCIICITNVKAYENEFFSIELPEGYKEDNIEGNAFKWDKDNKYIAVAITDNTQYQYDVKYYSKVSIEKQKEYIENNINNGLNEHNVNVKVTDIKKVHDNDDYYLEYDLFFPSSETTGHDIYQKGRMYTTSHYIITITYSSDKEITNDEEYTNMIKTFKILDSKIIYRKMNTKAFFTIIITLGVILGIIGYIRSNKKHK